ncbi:MAG: MFS transporter, partial [Candidatus Lambdaproteobacteria bacterium]|nr:MFS transporter [Candidatus Lambdaproteobacteria bacterium]
MADTRPSGGRAHFLFLNVGHAYDHLFMLLFPTVVLSLEREFGRPYAELLPLATGGFVAFAAGTLPAGWLGDRWSRRHMLTVFFVGIGAASVLTGLAPSPWALAAGLTAIGLFASIYHPVGTALVVQGSQGVGKLIGINGVAGNLGVAAAALTAGALTDLVHWRAAFIVPGALAIATGIGYALWAPRVAEPHRVGNAGAAQTGAGSSAGRPVLSPELVRAFAVLAIASACGGFIFNASLVALPKLFAVRLGDLATTTFGVGGLVSLVYAFGAIAQMLVGPLLDRHPMHRVMLIAALAQVPFLLAVTALANLSLLFAAGLMMFAIFGSVPVTDMLVARYSREHWRARVYALKHVIGLGISALAVPTVSLVYGATGAFAWLYGPFALLSLAVAAASFLLPRDAP